MNDDQLKRALQSIGYACFVAIGKYFLMRRFRRKPQSGDFKQRRQNGVQVDAACALATLAR